MEKDALEFEQKLRKKTLEAMTFDMFRKSSAGKFIGNMYFLVGLGSIFLYWKVFNLNIILSIILGIITWFVITFIVDRILTKFLRIDKTIEFIKSPEGVERLKKIGRYSDEEIKSMQESAKIIDEELKK